MTWFDLNYAFISTLTAFYKRAQDALAELYQATSEPQFLNSREEKHQQSPYEGPWGLEGLKAGRIYWWGRASIRIRPPGGYQAGVDSQVWVGKGEGVASGVGTISESACVGAASQVQRSTGSEHRKPAWEGALWFYHPASPMAACFTSYPFYCYTFSLSARIQWISSVLFFFVKTAPCYVIRALASNLK